MSDLAVERLEIDLDAKRIVSAVVRDVGGLYAGARVPLEVLPAADRAWLFSLVARAIGSSGAASGVWTLRDGTLENGADVRAVERSPALDTFLDVVAGTLLIDADSRPMRERTKGDSPA